MNNQSLILREDAELNKIIDDALKEKDSAHTRRAYRREIKAFLNWIRDENITINRQNVRNYRELLKGSRSDDAANQALSAIRLFVRECAELGRISHQDAESIAKIQNVTVRGERTGNWLTKKEAEQLLHLPDTSHLYGLRDRAILAVLIGCWLRRSEAASLTFDHIQQRDGQWCIINLKGKRNKFRSFAIPEWCKAIIDKWAEAAKIEDGHIFRQLSGTSKTDNTKIKVLPDPLSDKAIWRTAKRYSVETRLNRDFAPHALRRTGATLALDGAGDIRSIQQQLGHDSLDTTDKYLGRRDALRNPVGDFMNLKIKV
jgi:site-specific recombinase XerD